MSDYLQLDEYLAALDEAVGLIGAGAARASAEDERLDILLHRIAKFPPVYVTLTANAADSGSGALLAKLRAHVEAFVRKRAERCAVSTFRVRQYGVGRTL